MLDDLDDALVCLVFSFLTPTEVMLTTALLSRRFSDLSADNAIWRPQCKRRSVVHNGMTWKHIVPRRLGSRLAYKKAKPA